MNSLISRSRRLRFGLQLILAVTVFAPLVSASQERTSLKLLTIGNSFADNATAFLPDIAKAGGKDLVIFRANLGGCSFERHASLLATALADPSDPKGRPYKNNPLLGLAGKPNVSLPEALAAQKWDVVTIQQWSQLSYKPETFHPYVDQLIAAIHRYAPQAEIVIHETWAYREDHPFFQKNDGFTPQKMYDGLRASYRQLATETGFRILPVGDAYNAARQTPRWAYVPDTTFDFKTAAEGALPDQSKSINVGWHWTKNEKTGKPALVLDAIHSNAYGRFLGATVWYEMLYNATAPVSFRPAAISEDDATALRQLATTVVEAERAREKPVATAK